MLLMMMMHGATVHGRQASDEDARRRPSSRGSPSRRGRCHGAVPGGAAGWACVAVPEVFFLAAGAGATLRWMQIESPLETAAVHGHVDAMSVLTEHGAGVNAVGVDGRTAPLVVDGVLCR